MLPSQNKVITITITIHSIFIYSCLFLLDLSAAFDRVHHSILLSRLELRFGVKGQVIAWIESYLRDREQFAIENTKSSIRHLSRGVPQGESVLGPLLHDTQIYASFPSQSQQDLYLVKSKLEVCVKHIASWMVSNGLKINLDSCFKLSSSW